jgi:GNAT superfamily N-acetyltransferase
VTRPAGLILRVQEDGAGAVGADVLAALPEWFGFPDSVADCGILTLRAHTPYAAEIVVMGVVPEQHRCGIGRAMLEAAEAWLAGRDITYLQVKTLSPRSADEGCAATRAFYFGSGFRPLEEMPDLWGRDQPALQTIKTVPPTPPPVRSEP